MLDDEFFDEDYERICPKCGRDYDEIDKEYLICSKCGEIREPTEEDYMNGDADILSGRWW